MAGCVLVPSCSSTNSDEFPHHSLVLPHQSFEARDLPERQSSERVRGREAGGVVPGSLGVVAQVAFQTDAQSAGVYFAYIACMSICRFLRIRRSTCLRKMCRETQNIAIRLTVNKLLCCVPVTSSEGESNGYARDCLAEELANAAFSHRRR